MKQKLVLLPGLDGTGKLFADFVQALPAAFETETVRLPENGNFTYSELTFFLRTVTRDSSPFVLVAESYSTPFAIQYAAMNPPNLRGMVLCAGFAKSPIRGWRRFVYSFLTPLALHATLSRLFATYFLVGLGAPHALAAAVRSTVSSLAPKLLSSRIHEIAVCDAREQLGQIQVPILYLQALRDRLVPPGCLAEIRLMKPQTAVVAIDGPHLLLQREPRKAADAIAQFVQKLP